MQGRVNLEGYGATASILENILPEGAGPMSFRGGLGFQIASPTPGALTLIHPFVYRNTEKYLLLLTNDQLRIVENGGIVVRDGVGASITNGTFNTLTGWTDYSTGASTATGAPNGLVLFCDGPNPAGVYQNVTTLNPNTLHGLDIEVTRGPVLLRIGTLAGQDNILAETELRTGSHRISFTPAGSFYVDLGSTVRRETIVASIAIAGTGDLMLPTPWGVEALRSLRFEQSLNVMYVTDGSHQKRRIERHASGTSWSIVLSDEQDGPFRTPNIDETILVTPSTRQGNGLITSTKALFSSADIGSLFRITQNGQYEARTVTGEDQWTDPIRVTGVGTGRTITWTTSGTWSATIRLQRSVGNDSSWEDASGGTGDFSDTDNTGSPHAYADGQDNVVVYYRLGIKAGEYTSGSADITIFFAGGATDGIARITAVNTNLQAQMEVLASFAALTGSNEWAKGSWSDYLGWPKGVTTFDGRLWNGLGALFWGSVSEVYESHQEGDDPADAIARSIGVGAQAPHVVWMLSLQQLFIGCEGAEIRIRANALDEPLTTTAMTVREISTYGSADVQPVKVDTTGIFIEKSGRTPMEITIPAGASDYTVRTLARMHRDIGRAGIRQMAVARQPETRLFFIRGDGQVLVKLYDTNENALGWSRMITDGTFESVAVLPGTDEDEVYFMVRRTVAGAAVRYLEKLEPMYLESALAANRLDSYVRYDVADVEGAQSFEDVSGNGHVVTQHGNADLVVDDDFIGRAAIDMDGSGDYLDAPDSADFSLGSGDFTIDFEFDCEAPGGSPSRVAGQIDSSETTSTCSFRITRNASNFIAATVSVGSTNYTVTSTDQFTDTLNTGRHHGAFVRTGDVLRLFIDGVQQGGDVAISGSVNDSSNNLAIGRFGEADASYWNGRIGAFRLSVGIARWTEDFTAPTSLAEYTPDAYTKLLVLPGARTNLTVGAAAHLIGRTVRVLADGAYMGEDTIDANGQLANDLSTFKSVISAGLSYTGRYRSSKLALGARAGSALAQQGRPSAIALLLLGSTRAIEIGADFDTMDPLPELSGDGVAYDAGPGLVDETTDFFPIPAGHTRDPRLCLRMQSPFPVTVQGYVLAHHLDEKVKG